MLSRMGEWLLGSMGVIGCSEAAAKRVGVVLHVPPAAVSPECIQAARMYVASSRSTDWQTIQLVQTYLVALIKCSLAATPHVSDTTCCR
jgi:hypothetical protein